MGNSTKACMHAVPSDVSDEEAQERATSAFEEAADSGQKLLDHAAASNGAYGCPHTVALGMLISGIMGLARQGMSSLDIIKVTTGLLDQRDKMEQAEIAKMAAEALKGFFGKAVLRTIPDKELKH